MVQWGVKPRCILTSLIWFSAHRCRMRRLFITHACSPRRLVTGQAETHPGSLVHESRLTHLQRINSDKEHAVFDRIFFCFPQNYYFLNLSLIGGSYDSRVSQRREIDDWVISASCPAFIYSTTHDALCAIFAEEALQWSCINSLHYTHFTPEQIFTRRGDDGLRWQCRGLPPPFHYSYDSAYVYPEIYCVRHQQR